MIELANELDAQAIALEERCKAPSTASILGTMRRPWRKRWASAPASSGAGAAVSAAITAAVCATSSVGKAGFGPRLRGRRHGVRAADQMEFCPLCRRAEVRDLIVGPQPADGAVRLRARVSISTLFDGIVSALFDGLPASASGAV